MTELNIYVAHNKQQAWEKSLLLTWASPVGVELLFEAVVLQV